MRLRPWEKPDFFALPWKVLKKDKGKTEWLVRVSCKTRAYAWETKKNLMSFRGLFPGDEGCSYKIVYRP